MRRLAAPLMLAAARARRRPGRWLAPALGIAIAAAFAGGVAAEGVVAGDRAAQSALDGLSPPARTVRVTWDGALAPNVTREANGLFRGLGLGSRTDVVMLRPVRLDGVVVRLVAIGPLGRWLSRGPATRLGPCRSESCPMLSVGGKRPPSTLSTSGVHLHVVGSADLSSSAPLGFTPTAGRGRPLLVTGDPAGLQSLAGVSGVFRTLTWMAPLATSTVHSWQLEELEARLHRVQARLSSSGSQFTLTAPFAGLERARSQASAAPRRLWLVGGGAIAAFALFVVLAAGALRGDQLAELARLRNAGAWRVQSLLFTAAESAWLCGVALLAGSGLAIAAAAVLASAAGEPVGGVLAHSLITPTAAIALAGGWLATTALVTVLVLARSPRVLDALALAAISTLGLGLAFDSSGDDRLALLFAPLCCLAAGVLAFRAAPLLLRGAERVTRRGPVPIRLALVGLARAPTVPSLAIAFLAVSIGLGGFALAYRATLIRGAADQAADRVPLDETISPGPDFKTPLDIASIDRWRRIARGPVLPVRRTNANYPGGAGTVTVPALGVPAGGLPLIHGWRNGDGSASLAELAHRLRPPGPVRAPGAQLPADSRWLSLRSASPALNVSVTADLRAPGGAIRQVGLGVAGAHPSLLRARVPPGRWELEALELDEPSGLEITNGHQSGESPVGATQVDARVALGPLRALRRDHGPASIVRLGEWKATGAASSAPAPAGAGEKAVLRFATTGETGVLRPPQPSDRRPVPVIADPSTAASAGPSGTLALTVDGVPMTANVVGVIRRFPTLASGTAGFVVADEPTLASALDAQMPGQGRPDELWVSTTRADRVRAALQKGAFRELRSSSRADLEHRFASTPVARAVLGTLAAAAALAAALAVFGLLFALLGPARDVRIERDLEAQGVGPRGLRAEVRTGLVLASALGVFLGLGIAALLARLAVGSVQTAATFAAPRPSLVTVVPWGELAVWGVGAIAVLSIAGWLTTRSLIGRGGAGRRGSLSPAEGRGSVREEVAR